MASACTVCIYGIRRMLGVVNGRRRYGQAGRAQAARCSSGAPLPAARRVAAAG